MTRSSLGCGPSWINSSRRKRWSRVADRCSLIASMAGEMRTETTNHAANSEQRMKRIHYLVISLIVLALDAWTKWLVSGHISPHESISLIPNLFELVHVRNTGAAFGIGANSGSQLVPLLLNGGALAVFLTVVVYAIRTAVTDRVLQVGLHLILGGAIGNLLDRFRLGYVVDFLDV